MTHNDFSAFASRRIRNGFGGLVNEINLTCDYGQRIFCAIGYSAQLYKYR